MDALLPVKVQLTARMPYVALPRVPVLSRNTQLLATMYETNSAPGLFLMLRMPAPRTGTVSPPNAVAPSRMVKPSILTSVTPVATAMQRTAAGPMPHGEASCATVRSFAPTMCVTAAPSRARSVRFFVM